jgi:hypothetical protein
MRAAVAPIPLTLARRLCYNRSTPITRGAPVMDDPRLLQVQMLIRWCKEGPPGCIPVCREQLSLGSLRAASWEDAGDRALIERLHRWHGSAFADLAVPLSLTPARVRGWLIEQVLEVPTRLLFWVRDVTGQIVGHVGLARFDFTRRTVTVRDVVCGESGCENLVTLAVGALQTWPREAFGMEAVDGCPDRLAA